ncbi:MAG: cytochrome P450 [Myxococcota bacterium]
MVRSTMSVTGPQGCLALGNVRQLQRDPLNLFLRIRREHGDIARLRLGPEELFVFSHPDHLKYILADNVANWQKQERFRKAIFPILGNGLLLSEGDFWKRQRRIANPVFHRQRIASFADTMVRSGLEMLDGWRARLAKEGEDTVLDVAAEMKRLTLKIVGRALFSRELGDEGDKVGPAVDQASSYIFLQTNSMFMTPKYVPTPGMRRFRAASKLLDGLIYRFIEERRSGKTQGDDLLQMMLDARDPETGESLSDQQLRDELTTFYLAGHETTSNALSWTFYLLGKHPTVERELRREIGQVLGKRFPRMEDLPNLPYTARVIDESMRLYPPAWIFGRTSVGPDEIGGVRIKKGTNVLWCPWVIHRDPRFFEHPEGFDPDHFLPEKVKTRHLYAYTPFGGGQRKCIGAGFATMEMQILVPVILQAFRLQLEPGFQAEPMPAVTLSPKNGVRMRVEPA